MSWMLQVPQEQDGWEVPLHTALHPAAAGLLAAHAAALSPHAAAAVLAAWVLEKPAEGPRWLPVS